MKTFIIAEAGVNHNGSLKNAFKLVDIAIAANVDAIKFQTFNPKLLASKHAETAPYQKNIDKSNSQLEMLTRINLSKEKQRKIFEYCNLKKIKFMSSPFDIESSEFLFELGLDTIKIPSGEITNLPLLRHIGKSGRKIILSSGLSTLSEVRNGLNVLINSGTDKEKITILHANSMYPSPIEDINLKAMLTIKEELKVPVGYSDHSLGIDVPIIAVALGATVIEKHFTIDKKMDGPDHKASLNPDELSLMVKKIRETETILGSEIKKPTKSEMVNITSVRKSIVASSAILKGELFTEDNIATKRPAVGLSPMLWDEVIGQRAEKNYEPDDFL